ncbi:uncharacterized protein LOC143355019 [Halictus rubicundus]|uniref:uncharacterized protein LOC143355019 n=1 Tax=Halictus rubicundus TaxID=77578 RepID=UPI004035B244
MTDYKSWNRGTSNSQINMSLSDWGSVTRCEIEKGERCPRSTDACSHLRDDAGDCIRPVIRGTGRVRIKALTVFEVGNQSIEPAGANMIEITVLLLGVYGVLAVPDTPPIDGNPVRSACSPLPGTENLDEKALPLSKLVLDDQPSSLGGPDTMKQIREASELPGTQNLAEKRIPLLILEKLSRPAGIEAWNSSDLRV